MTMHLIFTIKKTFSSFASCRAVKFDLERMPPASVIIIFYDEPFSTLMRSVHSVLNLTPPRLLKEIILVDDGNEDSENLDKIADYVNYLPKCVLVHNPKRSGIVGARLLGIETASSEIFVILDSHIEVQPMWLEPLLDAINKNNRVMVMPQIDGIDPKTFYYSAGGIGCTLGFIWKLMEHVFYPNDKRRRKSVVDLVESPTMAGGLFAAQKKFFMEIGAYDRGMTYWGVENIELSFRLWLCGGVLKCSECSRVFHIFREGRQEHATFDVNSLTRNKLRTMAVWMDEFGDLSWNVLGRPIIDMGDLSERVALRKRLQCKPFSYFMNEVWPESDVRNLTRDVPFMGYLKNKATGLCLSTTSDNPGSAVLMEPCHKPGMMYFRKSGRIMPVRNDEACLNSSWELQWCRNNGMDSARWRFAASRQIVAMPNLEEFEDMEEKEEKGADSPVLAQQSCLAAVADTTELRLTPCFPSDKNYLRHQHISEDQATLQIWDWESYKPSWQFNFDSIMATQF